MKNIWFLSFYLMELRLVGVRGECMILKNFLEKAFERGEKMKAQMLDDVLNSRLLSELMKSEKLIQAAVSILEARQNIEKAVAEKVSCLAKAMKIPSSEDLQSISGRLARMEKELELIQHRKLKTNFVKANKVKPNTAKSHLKKIIPTQKPKQKK
jgi:hypothetical protein